MSLSFPCFEILWATGNHKRTVFPGDPLILAQGTETEFVLRVQKSIFLSLFSHTQPPSNPEVATHKSLWEPKTLRDGHFPLWSVTLWSWEPRATPHCSFHSPPPAIKLQTQAQPWERTAKHVTKATAFWPEDQGKDTQGTRKHQEGAPRSDPHEAVPMLVRAELAHRPTPSLRLSTGTQGNCTAKVWKLPWHWNHSSHKAG